MQRASSSSGLPENPIWAALRATSPADGWVSLEAFVEAALYDPAGGYYRRTAERVGHRDDRDFYTASSLGPVFARLVLDSVLQLLPGPPEAFTFVEIGAEPNRYLLSELAHPFRQHRQIRLGEPLSLQGPCVVFSNELFDAQPFRRFRRMNGQWRELGVNVNVASPTLNALPVSGPLPPDLPTDAPEGYVLDYPSGSRRLAAEIAEQNWQGLFLAFDYGLPWPVLASDRPAGTARTYRAHRQGGDLLGDPGEQDITHHICWDHLAAALRQNGFSEPELVSQESFFMRYSAEAIRTIIESDPGQLNPARQTLKTLLHPENMGRKFQVLHALRSLEA